MSYNRTKFMETKEGWSKVSELSDLLGCRIVYCDGRPTIRKHPLGGIEIVCSHPFCQQRTGMVGCMEKARQKWQEINKAT